MFKLADSDGDQFLSRAEFREVFQNFDQQSHLLPSEQYDLMLLNESCKLIREEMSRIEKSDKTFSLMDRNHDNSISVDEFIKVPPIFGTKIFGSIKALTTLSLIAIYQNDFHVSQATKLSKEEAKRALKSLDHDW